MGFFNKLKHIFSKVFRKNNNELNFLAEEEIVKQLPTSENVHIELPKDELVSFSDEILDTKSRVSVEKLKHNIEILVKKAKETGKIDNFKLIREDDFFPTNWEWKVLSKNTNLEKIVTPLSYELRKAHALEQSGIKQYTEVLGMRIPNNISDEEIDQALLQVDKTYGSVLLPSKFRSTKHFTINTPLGATGKYNNVESNRDYIIIDDINTFLSSKYAYSVSYRDAYLDISHESLPISEKAIVLINDEKYERIIKDEKIARELSQRKIVRFKGDEKVAINMVLTEMGVLPYNISHEYVNYDNEVQEILEKSIRNLAKKNDLFFDKSHGGELKPDGGHFSDYYDGKNKDYEKACKEFIAFLKYKFPEQKGVFPGDLKFTEDNSIEIVEKIGTTNLSKAINEYNELVSYRAKKRIDKYNQDRQKITPEIHQQFVKTIALINNFYKTETTFESDETKMKIEEIIRIFIQGETVSEQLKAAKLVWRLLPSKNLQKTEITMETEATRTISMKQIVKNAIANGKITTEQIINSDKAESTEIQKQQNQMEGATIGD